MKLITITRKGRSLIKDFQNNFTPRQLREEIQQTFWELNEQRKQKIANKSHQVGQMERG